MEWYQGKETNVIITVVGQGWRSTNSVSALNIRMKTLLQPRISAAALFH
jgi:hypothetical protein